MKLNKYYICLLISLLTCIRNIYGQPLNYNFDRYDTEKGLSSNHIHCIFQDSKGFIWLGTPLGLIRFNGYSFTDFKHNEDDSTSIGKGDVWAIYEDHNNNLWVGTQGGGLNLYNRNKDNFIHYYDHGETGKSVNDNNINTITGDSFNNLWIGTGYGGLNCLNLKTKKFVYYKNNTLDPSSISNNSIMTIISENENLWVGTWGGGLNLFDYKNKKFTHFLFDSKTNIKNTANVIWTIYQDKTKNVLWLGTWGSGLLSFNKNSRQFINFSNNPYDKSTLSNNVVLSLLQDNYGHFWVGTESGLNLMDRKTNKFSIPPLKGAGQNEDLRGASIYSLFNDKQGIVWIGTFGQGLNSLDKNKYKFVVTHLPNDLIGSWVNCVYEDSDQNLWIGTGENGILKYKRKSNYFESFRNQNTKLVNKNVVSICKLNEKQLLISTFKGIYQVNKENGAMSLFHGENETTNSHLVNYKNNLIVLKKDKSLISYNAVENQFKEIVRLDTFPIMRNFIFGKDSSIWMGSDNMGLFKYNMQNKTFDKFRHDFKNKISDNSIRCLFEDRIGNIWIGTSMGLNKFNPLTKIITKFSEKDGLPNSCIADIIEDTKGNIWISTLNGVSQMDVKKNIFVNYTEQDGLPDKTPKFFKAKDGQLVMTGSKGFSIFNPDQITRNPYVPPVIITDFKLFNKSVIPGDNNALLKDHISRTNEIILNYKQSVISFSWVGLNFRLPEKNQYAYKLEGLEKEWNYVGTSRNTTYTNLSPGIYTFRIKASNNDGIWNETGASVKLIVLPPIWKRWWFKLLIIVIISGLLYSLYRRRIWHLMRQKTILQNKVIQRTSDINRHKEILQNQKEALSLQSDHLQEANFLLRARKEELETAAEELKSQDEKLYQINEELIRLNLTKDRLFSIVAHDLKNPFNAIIGFTEILTEKFDKITHEKRHKMLQNILVSSKNAYKLLENLLEWARSQTNNIEFNPTNINIRAIIDTTTELLKLQIESKKIAVKITVSENMYVFADNQMVETVMRNLLNNAIKFSYEGGKITLSATESHMYSFQEKNATHHESVLSDNHIKPFIKISVADTGTGMTTEVKEKLFRIETTHSTNGTSGESGTGLGLILCREFAEKNEGKVTVESEPGKGSTFNLFLPRSQEVLANLQSDRQKIIKLDDEHEDLPLTEKTILNSAGEKYQILVIEDNHELRNYLTKDLTQDFQVEEAKNGKEGLEKALYSLPDIIISDVMMPELDGFELCKLLKNNEHTCHIPIILLTAKVGDENHLRGLETGANDYLMKPFNIKLLKVKIRNMLELQQRIRDRYLNHFYVGPSDLPISSIDEMFVKKAIDIIEKNMDDIAFNVEKFSEDLNMSYTQLYRKLNALINLSPGDLIRNIRLKRAAQLISQGHLNINEICFEVGFKDHSYFTKCFKKEFGVLPKDYVLKTTDTA